MTEWGSTGTTLGIDEAFAQIAHVRGVAGRFRCSVKPGSRLAVFEGYLRRLQERDRTPRIDPRFPAVFAHGSRDAAELSFILGVLADEQGATLVKALPDLLGGAPLPSGDRYHTPRNTQFEHFVGAWFKHCGYTVTLDEPDIVFIHEGMSGGIAAKRGVSGQQLIRRVREGIRQLAKAGVPGFYRLIA